MRMKLVVVGWALAGLSLLSGSVVSAQQRQTTTVYTAPDGRTAARSSSTVRQDGAVVHQASRTGLNGRTASRQDVYTRNGSSHTRTGGAGRTLSWSRTR